MNGPFNPYSSYPYASYYPAQYGPMYPAQNNPAMNGGTGGPAVPDQKSPIGSVTYRNVGNIEEVKALPADMAGGIGVYPCPSQNCIFTKQMDNNGNIVINAYKHVDTAALEPKYVTDDVVQSLQKQIDDLRASMNGGMNNAQPTTMAAPTTSYDVQKSITNDYASAGRQSFVTAGPTNGQQQEY